MPAADVTPDTAAARALRRAVAQARGWGWPGAFGLACVVVALTASAFWLPALRRQAESLEAEADAEQARARRLASQQRLKATATPAPQRFLDGFPSARARQERVATLMALAADHGLEVRRAEFRLGEDVGLGLSRYSVSMPLTGSYVQLREFVEAAQTRDPALGLDRVRLRRASANANTVEIELGWTLFMQAEASPDAPNQPVRSAAR